ncbi:hypothetical protein M9458_033660, partial [Cirrhinus mrigala]
TDLWSEDKNDFQKHLGTPSPAGGELLEQVKDYWHDRRTTWRKQTRPEPPSRERSAPRNRP